MVLLLAVVAAVPLALLLGGRLGRLADLELRSAWLFYAAIGVQVAAFPSGILPWALTDGAATALSLSSYALLIVASIRNRHVTGASIVAGGMLSNLAAILANGNHMPALPSAMAAAGLDFAGVHQNSVAASHPALPWLVDRFAVPQVVPAGNVYSVGDVLIAVGAMVLVCAAAGARLPLLRRPRLALSRLGPRRWRPSKPQLGYATGDA